MISQQGLIIQIVFCLINTVAMLAQSHAQAQVQTWWASTANVRCFVRGDPFVLWAVNFSSRTCRPITLICWLRRNAWRGAPPHFAEEAFYLHYVGEHQSCCRLFLHGQTQLVVAPSSRRCFDLTDAEIVSRMREHFYFQERNAIELKCSYCGGCRAHSYGVYPIQHTRDDCSLEDVNDSADLWILPAWAYA